MNLKTVVSLAVLALSVGTQANAHEYHVYSPGNAYHGHQSFCPIENVKLRESIPLAPGLTPQQSMERTPPTTRPVVFVASYGDIGFVAPNDAPIYQGGYTWIYMEAGQRNTANMYGGWTALEFWTPCYV